MNNVREKISLSFIMLLVLLMSFGSVFAATEYVPVYLTVKDASGTVLKTDNTYEFKAGDVIYATAYCSHEKALYWSQNSLWMQERGYKVNDKGMALLGYGFDISQASEFTSSSDPTQLAITIPNYAVGSTHTLKIQAVGAVDYLTEGDITYEAYTGFKMDIKIKAEEVTPETTISETITKVNDTTLRVTATVTNGTFSKIVYNWDGGTNQESTSNPLDVTIPNFAAGSTHTLTATASTTNGKTATKTYKVTMPAATTPETTISANISKTNDTTLKVTATVTNGTFSKMVYNWDGGANQESTSNPLNITIPNFAAGSTHTLTVTASTTNGKTATKTYTITIPKEEVIDDELIVEPWMKEDNDMVELAVSLRNDSDEYDKGNKNFYALNEEIVYYVDYKNGGDDITREVKLVLELPLDFKVIDAFGGTVDTEKHTITWTYADGLEEGQSGTKVVKVAYTNFDRTSKKYEIVYPVADICERNKVVDSSAVINYIFKDEETEITEEHYPYMFGDEEKPTFRPDSTITRDEGALVLTRILGIDTSGTAIETLYPDLDQTYPEAQKAIVAATKLGLINGYPDGTYRPKNKMTTAEFMKIIATYIETHAEEEDIRGLEVKEDTNIKIYKNPTNIYITGTTTVSEHWASDCVTLLARLNMTPVSSSNRNLGLDEQITRAEVAQLVNFYLLRAPADVDSSTKTPFDDVSKKHDLFADIVEATREAHTFTLTKEGYEVEVDD